MQSSPTSFTNDREPRPEPADKRRRNGAAFGIGAVVGVAGGLIGLGGAEFRLPFLVGHFRYRLLLAIVINLVVSLVTVIFSLAFRVLGPQGIAPVLEQWPVALNILAGSIIGSYAGVHFATRVSEQRLAFAVAIVLMLLGLLLAGHHWLFGHNALLLADPVRIGLGLAAGLMIGAVSSLLGVAGGELIIPTLVLLFGLDIKLAGSTSLAISIPTVIVGIMRYRQRPVFRELSPEKPAIILMALGSILGALIGSRLLPYISASVLQLALGIILFISAAKMFLKSRRAPLPNGAR